MPAPLTPSDVPSPLLALSGTVLESRYELGRVLGTGGMGAVFEAKHLRLDRVVAIKVLRPVFVGHDEYIKRFLREAKVASKLRHRNIVEILDFGEAAGGLVYSVMELLQGQDLDQYLRVQPGQRMPWRRACAVLLQVASGLKAAHAGGIIHRDIKPANCFLTTDEDGKPLVKLVDFGIAKVEDADQSQQLTATSDLLGTPAYIAPELVMSKQPASARSDVYSLGVLAYRMLTGRVPFAGETAFQVLHRACFEAVPPLRAHVPDLPPTVEAFVLQLLAKTPDERPQDMQAVRDALVSLGRETLGAEAVQIPVSSALRLEPVETTGALESSSVATLPRAAVPPAPPAQRSEPTITKVVHAPHAMDLERPAPRPAEAPPRIIVSPAPAPALPAPPYAALRAAPVGSHGAMPLRPHRAAGGERRDTKRTLWIVAGSLVAVVTGAALALSMMLPPSSESVPSPSEAPAASMEPTPAAEPTMSVSPNAALSATETSSPSSPTGSPDTPDPPPSTPAGGPAATTTVVPTPSTTVQPAPSDSTTPATTTGSGTSGSSSKPTPTKPVGPPSDSTLKKKLAARIKSKCADSLSGQTIKVSFIVLDEGQMMGLNASPKGAAANCAMEQARGTTFRKRDSPSPIDITVK